MLPVITTEIGGLKGSEWNGIVILSFPLSNEIGSIDQKLIVIVWSFPDSIIIQTIFFSGSQETISLKNLSDREKPNTYQVRTIENCGRNQTASSKISRRQTSSREFFWFSIIWAEERSTLVQRSLTTSCDQRGDILVVLFQYISIVKTRLWKCKRKLEIGFNKKNTIRIQLNKKTFIYFCILKLESNSNFAFLGVLTCRKNYLEDKISF